MFSARFEVFTPAVMNIYCRPVRKF